MPRWLTDSQDSPSTVGWSHLGSINSSSSSPSPTEEEKENIHVTQLSSSFPSNTTISSNQQQLETSDNESSDIEVEEEIMAPITLYSLPDEVLTRIGEFFWSECRKTTWEDGKGLSGALPPLLVSHKLCYIYLPILYTNPHLTHRTMTSFTATILANPRRTDHIKSLTVRPHDEAADSRGAISLPLNTRWEERNPYRHAPSAAASTGLAMAQPWNPYSTANQDVNDTTNRVRLAHPPPPLTHLSSRYIPSVGTRRSHPYGGEPITPSYEDSSSANGYQKFLYLCKTLALCMGVDSPTGDDPSPPDAPDAPHAANEEAVTALGSATNPIPVDAFSEDIAEDYDDDDEEDDEEDFTVPMDTRSLPSSTPAPLSNPSIVREMLRRLSEDNSTTENDRRGLREALARAIRSDIEGLVTRTGGETSGEDATQVRARLSAFMHTARTARTADTNGDDDFAGMEDWQLARAIRLSLADAAPANDDGGQAGPANSTGSAGATGSTGPGFRHLGPANPVHGHPSHNHQPGHNHARRSSSIPTGSFPNMHGHTPAAAMLLRSGNSVHQDPRLDARRSARGMVATSTLPPPHHIIPKIRAPLLSIWIEEAKICSHKEIADLALGLHHLRPKKARIDYELANGGWSVYDTPVGGEHNELVLNLRSNFVRIVQGWAIDGRLLALAFCPLNKVATETMIDRKVEFFKSLPCRHIRIVVPESVRSLRFFAGDRSNWQHLENSPEERYRQLHGNQVNQAMAGLGGFQQMFPPAPGANLAPAAGAAALQAAPVLANTAALSNATHFIPPAPARFNALVSTPSFLPTRPVPAPAPVSQPEAAPSTAASPSATRVRTAAITREVGWKQLTFNTEKKTSTEEGAVAATPTGEGEIKPAELETVESSTDRKGKGKATEVDEDEEDSGSADRQVYGGTKDKPDYKGKGKARSVSEGPSSNTPAAASSAMAAAPSDPEIIQAAYTENLATARIGGANEEEVSREMQIALERSVADRPGNNNMGSNNLGLGIGYRSNPGTPNAIARSPTRFTRPTTTLPPPHPSLPSRPLDNDPADFRNQLSTFANNSFRDDAFGGRVRQSALPITQPPSASAQPVRPSALSFPGFGLISRTAPLVHLARAQEAATSSGVATMRQTQADAIMGVWDANTGTWDMGDQDQGDDQPMADEDGTAAGHVGQAAQAAPQALPAAFAVNQPAVAGQAAVGNQVNAAGGALRVERAAERRLFPPEDSHPDEMIHPRTVLFELEIADRLDFEDYRWFDFGSDLPSQLCRIQPGTNPWNRVPIGDRSFEDYTFRSMSGDSEEEESIRQSPYVPMDSPEFDFEGSGSDFDYHDEDGDVDMEE